MCGIAGFWRAGSDYRDLGPIVRAMTDVISYRGPDDQGHWIDPNVGLALGHRRLSIIDLSPEGHQPMVSASGRFVMVFNGEVYNYEEIRRELGDRVWRGHSDTEVMLEAIETWGLEAAVRRFVGMFAFALWDRQERTLSLVRDRLGIKPLYYGWTRDALVFGSELKPFRCYPEFEGEIDRGALCLFIRHNYIPAPYTIYRGVYKLPPGTILTLRHAIPDTRPSPAPYWSLRQVADEGVAHPFTGSEGEAEAELERRLNEAVRLRMVADVPLGAFLSGGIDSSLVVALMQAQSSRPVRTFTIGFHEEGFNEAEHARKVARHLGTDHTELYLTPQEAMAVIPELPAMYDEPFSDGSQIPTFLVSRLARESVTVSLSGDGGDELFGGYLRYFVGPGTWNRVRWLTRPGRRSLAGALRAFSPGGWDRLTGPLGRLVPAGITGDRVHKWAELLDVADADQLYSRLLSHVSDPRQVVCTEHEPTTMMMQPESWVATPDLVHRMMYVDAMMYLPDDILTKVDRASMAVSLEARVPVLDHRVVEFAWKIPVSMKVRNGQGKWILRNVLYRHVPRELFERPKKGFSVPLGVWLRGPLRDWAESLLDRDRLDREGLLRTEAIRAKWDEHLSGDRWWQGFIWNILMFQAWLEEHRGSPALRA